MVNVLSYYLFSAVSCCNDITVFLWFCFKCFVFEKILESRPVVLNQWAIGGPWKHFEVGHRTFSKIARFIEKFCFICVTVVKFTFLCVFSSFDGSNNE